MAKKSDDEMGYGPQAGRARQMQEIRRWPTDVLIFELRNPVRAKDAPDDGYTLLFAEALSRLLLANLDNGSIRR